jgi:hypothetical protein
LDGLVAGFRSFVPSTLRIPVSYLVYRVGGALLMVFVVGLSLLPLAALAEHGLEVVEPPRTVEAELLGEADSLDEGVPGHALLRHIEPESHCSPFSFTKVATRL